MLDITGDDMFVGDIFVVKVAVVASDGMFVVVAGLI